MSNLGWQTPDAEPSGFTSLYKVTKRAHALNREDFVQAFPLPGLLVRHEGNPLETPEKSDSSVQLLTVTVQASGILRYLNKLGFLCKRPGNPYAHLISVGRSQTNDLVLAIDSVSKVHGYFVQDQERWTFTDRTSTNGSRINDRPVEPGVRVPLHDGDKLKLGRDVVLEVLEPHSLYDYLKRLP